MYVPYFPLSNINEQNWKKKVQKTAMYTIPSEDQALPVLIELQQITKRLIDEELEATLSQNCVPFFFNEVFQPVCYKMIRSRYFKKVQLYNNVYAILGNSLKIFYKYLDIGIKYPNFIKIFSTVLNIDEYFFRNSDSYSNYEPEEVFSSSLEFPLDQRQKLGVGDFVDFLKTDPQSGKKIWIPAKIMMIEKQNFGLKIMYELTNEIVIIQKTSHRIAKYESKTTTYESWRNNLKVGETVNFHHGNQFWGRGFVKRISALELGQLIHVGMNGAQAEEYKFSRWHPNLQKDGLFTSDGLKQIKKTDPNLNAYLFSYFQGKRIYALPNQKMKNKFIISIINELGQKGLFQEIFKTIAESKNLNLFEVMTEIVLLLKPILHPHFFLDFSNLSKSTLDDLIFHNKSNEQKKAYHPRTMIKILKNLSKLRKCFEAQENFEKEELNLILQLLLDELDGNINEDKVKSIEDINQIFKSKLFESSYQTILNWFQENNIFQKVTNEFGNQDVIKIADPLIKFALNNKLLLKKDIVKLYEQTQLFPETSDEQYQLLQRNAQYLGYLQMNYLINLLKEKNVLTPNDTSLMVKLSENEKYFPVQRVMPFLQEEILKHEEKKQSELQKDYKEKLISLINGKTHQTCLKYLDCYLGFINCTELGSKFTSLMQLLAKILKKISKRSDTGFKIVQSSVLIINLQQKLSNINSQNFLNFLESLQCLLHDESSSLQVLRFLKIAFDHIQKNPNFSQKQYFLFLSALLAKIKEIQDSSYMCHDLEFLMEQIYKNMDFKNIIPEAASTAVKFFEVINCQIGNLIIRDDNVYRTREIKFLKMINYIEKILSYSDHAKSVVLKYYTELWTNSLEVEDLFAKLEENMHILFQSVSHKQFQKANLYLKIIDSILCLSENTIGPTITPFGQLLCSPSNRVSVQSKRVFGVKTEHKFIQVSLNSTVKHIKSIIAKIKGVKEEDIIVSINGKRLKLSDAKFLYQEMGGQNEKISVCDRDEADKQSICPMDKSNLIINRSMNVHAQKCLQLIFLRYSDNGRMSKDQVSEFIKICLGTYNTQKTERFMEENDPEKKGYVSKEKFLEFYRKSAKEKPITVIRNLQALGAKGYYHINPQENAISLRDYLSESPLFQIIINQMLENEICHQAAYTLKTRLKLDEKDLREIEQMEQIEELMEIIDQSHSKRLYSLNLISLLMLHEDRERREAFHEKFKQLEGFEFLMNFYNEVFAKDPQNVMSLHHMSELYTILTILKQEWICCLENKKSVQRLMSLQSIEDIYQEYGSFKIQANSPIFQLINNNLSIFSSVIIQISCKIANQHLSNVSVYHYQNLIKSIINILFLTLFSSPNPQIYQALLKTMVFSPNSNSLLKQYLSYFLLSQIVLNNQTPKSQYIDILLSNIISTQDRQKREDIYQLLSSLSSFKNIEFTQSKYFKEAALIMLNQLVINQEKGISRKCAKALSCFEFDCLSDRLQEVCLKLIGNCFSGAYSEEEIKLITKILGNIVKVSSPARALILKVMSSEYKETLKFGGFNESFIREALEQQGKKQEEGGIKNLGSLGYLNSILYSLYTTKKIRNAILTNELSEDQQHKNQRGVIEEIRKIFILLHYTSHKIINPQRLISVLSEIRGQIDVIEPKDAHQFLLFLLQVFRRGFKDQSVIDLLLNGHKQYTLQCFKCTKQRKHTEIFNTLFLEITNQTDLSKMLSLAFTQQESLKCFCENCQEELQHTIKISLKEIPQILILFLKRTKFNFDTFTLQKTNKQVHFPSEEYLVLPPDIFSNGIDSSKYSLSGTLIHDGNCEIAHYYYVSQQFDQWIRYDDCVITKLLGQPSKYLTNESQTPSIFFYAKDKCTQEEQIQFWEKFQKSNLYHSSLKMMKMTQKIIDSMKFMLTPYFSELCYRLLYLSPTDTALYGFCFELTFRIWLSYSFFLKSIDSLISISQKLPMDDLEINGYIINFFQINKIMASPDLEKKKKIMKYLEIVIPKFYKSNPQLIYEWTRKRFISDESITKEPSGEQLDLWLHFFKKNTDLLKQLQEKSDIVSTLSASLAYLSHLRLDNNKISEKIQKLHKFYDITLLFIQNNLSNSTQMLTPDLLSIVQPAKHQILIERGLGNSQIFCFLHKKILNYELQGVEHLLHTFLTRQDEKQLNRIKALVGFQQINVEFLKNAEKLEIDSLDFRFSKFVSSFMGKTCILQQTYCLGATKPAYTLQLINIICKAAHQSGFLSKYLFSLSNPSIEFESIFDLWKYFLASYWKIVGIQSQNTLNSIYQETCELLQSLLQKYQKMKRQNIKIYTKCQIEETSDKNKFILIVDYKIMQPSQIRPIMQENMGLLLPSELSEKIYEEGKETFCISRLVNDKKVPKFMVRSEQFSMMGLQIVKAQSINEWIGETYLQLSEDEISKKDKNLIQWIEQ